MSQLRTNSIVPVGGVPAGASGGGIIQTVQGTIKTDAFATSSTSYVDVTGLNASITPRSTSSKILVMCEINGSCGNAGTWHCQIKRNGTAIALGDANGSRRQDSTGSCDTAAGDRVINTTFIFVDTPASTSAQTYQVAINNGDGGSTSYINRPDTDNNDTNGCRTSSKVVLLEVSG